MSSNAFVNTFSGLFLWAENGVFCGNVKSQYLDVCVESLIFKDMSRKCP